VVDAFLAASRTGNFEALLTVLDPEVVFRIDGAASPKGVSREIRSAPAVARQFSGRALGARTALVDGAVAAIVAPHGHLFLVLNFTIRNDKIVEIEAVADHARLRQLHLAVLDD
jgi:RNA polymerase sigma-70 factor (ECF subfamily)